MRLKLFISFFAILFLMSACSRSDKSSVENVLSKNPDLVMFVDFYNKDQVNQLKALGKEFPKNDFVKTVAVQFNKIVGQKYGTDITFENTVLPVIKDKWQLGFSVTFPDSYEFGKKERDFKDLELYLAGKFDQADKVEMALTKIINTELKDKVKFSESEGVKNWVSEVDNFYLSRYKNVFVLTVNQVGVDAAIKRLKDGGGIATNESFKKEIEKINSDSLGYTYLSKKIVGDGYGAFFESLGMFGMSDYFAGLGNSYGVFYADKGGIMSSSFTEVVNEKLIKNYAFDPNYEISIANKINKDGLFYYLESPGFYGVFSSMVAAFTTSMNLSNQAVDENNLYFDEPQSSAKSSFKDVLVASVLGRSEKVTLEVNNELPDFIKQIALIGGITDEEIRNILDSPFVITMSDKVSFIPGVGIYLQIDESELDSTKKLIEGLAKYMDQMLVSLNALFGKEGVFKQKIEVVNGAAMRKIYLDKEAIPKDAAGSFAALSVIPGFSPEAESLYYGLTSDNLLVFALQGNLEDKYGKNPVSQDAKYKEAVSKIGSSYGYNVFYFETGEFLKWLDRMIGAAKMGVYAGSGETLEEYNGVRAVLSTFKYLISGGAYVDGKIINNTYVKIGD